MPDRSIGNHEYSPFKSLDVDETKVEVTTLPCVVGWLYLFNSATTNRYLKFYGLASADVTVGTTVPLLTLPIPGLVSTDDVVAVTQIPDGGLFFPHGLTLAATTGFANNDTGAPGNNEVIVNLGIRLG